VPAAFNNIVGLKPTRGAVSTAGVVPACRTLDCVSVFAQTCSDAAAVLEAAAGPDPKDPYSRAAGQRRAWPPTGFRFGVPPDDQLNFFGDAQSATAFHAAVRRMVARGGVRVTFDYDVFRQVAQLLYSGPWVAERFAAIRKFLAEHPDALYPVTAKIIGGAKSITAADTFDAMYRLAELARAAEAQWKGMDFMLLPTAGTHYTHAEVASEPITTNSNLGYYTNFVNLLDLAAIAVPAGTRGGEMPFGVTLIGPAWSEDSLLTTADLFHRGENAATGRELAALESLAAIAVPYCPRGYVPLAVCGAHLTGQPLNWQLTQAGAYLIEACRTSAEYRLYALRGTVPAKPGLVYAGKENGAAIEVEVWAVPANTFGGFVAAVPPPLGIGSCTLGSGRVVKSFIVEPYAVSDATEITQLGGWRGYISAGAR
jgi:allophanate hydrolase